MKKLALVLALAAALAACGKNNPAPTASTSPSSTTSSSSSTSTGATPPSTASTDSTSSTPSASGSPSTSTAASTSTAPAGTTVAAGAPSGSTASMGAGASGEAVFNQTCQVCHAAGVAGAPKMGDKADWGPRIAQGKDTLYQHAIAGYTGKKGMMPPKGGNTALADADVKAAVDYMVAKAQ